MAHRAVILTGNGRGFCAGGDLRFALAVNPETPGNSFLALTQILNACILELRQMSKPVIAAINGPATGAGLFLALACDLRVMADTAYLKQSNTSYGLSIPATRALELGLVNRIVPEAALLNEAHKLADRVARMPVDTLGRVKRLMNGTFDASLEEQLERERQEIAASANSPEGREGISAFLNKRQPNFRLDLSEF